MSVNRRQFIKALPALAAGAAVVSQVELPRARRPGESDTEYIQRMVDSGQPIIGGSYVITGPIDLRRRCVHIQNANFHYTGSTCFVVDDRTARRITANTSYIFQGNRLASS